VDGQGGQLGQSSGLRRQDMEEEGQDGPEDWCCSRSVRANTIPGAEEGPHEVLGTSSRLGPQEMHV
jgi:hypothetical protein